jgi:uncharacterized protein YdbL (DUF1318 family)
MGNKFAKLAVSVLCALLAACAFITVNVYFPEKDVKQAYKSLDDMLLKQGDKNAPNENAAPEGGPKPSEEKPTSLLEYNQHFHVSFVRAAYADEDLGKRLAEELSQMPEVQKAYADIRSRIPQLHALFGSGAIGEGSGGNIVVLDRSKLGDNQSVVDAVNNDRKTVISAMAKATLKITGQPQNTETMKKALTDSAKTFASVRQEKAKPGWFIQLPNGRWVQK